MLITSSWYSPLLTNTQISIFSTEMNCNTCKSWILQMYVVTLLLSTYHKSSHLTTIKYTHSRQLATYWNMVRMLIFLEQNSNSCCSRQSTCVRWRDQERKIAASAPDLLLNRPSRAANTIRNPPQIPIFKFNNCKTILQKMPKIYHYSRHYFTILID